jgi:hypothetical protein
MMRRLPPSLLPLAALVLVAGCSKVIVRPEGELPKALVVPAPAKVAVVVTPETANYTHKESRASVDYEAHLGPAHRQLVEEIFKAEFSDAKVFESVDAARLEPGVMAIFEPRIEQFSFANAKETGGVYCAVTIRYQIGIYEPSGTQIDTLTLTGYGSGPAAQIGNGEDELAIAGYAAMRDAAAKFLTQFPTLDVAKPLLAAHALAPKEVPAPGSAEAVAAAADLTIEAVPLNEQPVAAQNQPASVPPASGPPASTPPAQVPPANPPASVPPDSTPPPNQMAPSRRPAL